MNPIIYFLPAILLLGTLTSYEDYKFGKIRNHYILLAVFYSIAINLVLVLKGISIPYQSIILNFIIAVIFGFFLWHLGIWTPGDAKLLAAFASLIPLNYYEIGFTNYFPSFTLLINTFVPIFLVLLFIVIIKTDWFHKKNAILHVLRPRLLLKQMLILFVLMWVVILLLRTIGIQSNFFLSLTLSILLFILVLRYTSKKLTIVFILLFCLRLILDKGVYTIQFLWEFLAFFFFIVFFRGVLSYMSFHLFTKKVNIPALKRGMIPAEDIFKKGTKYDKKPQSGLLAIRKEKSYLVKSGEEGLEQGQVRELKSLFKRKRLSFNKIRIKETIPLAPFLFAGVLITIAVKGNLILFTVELIARFL